MQDFEKLGVFYLGRPYDLGTGKPRDGLVLYDSNDLVTHAVCVGMTGSGKTGLCLSIIEEAAIDGIPSIVIDPKGDLSNLLLTFPELRAEDFRPWINEDDARRAGKTPDAFAAEQAELWKKGLEQWGEDGARIQRLRDSADFVIYTPGSNAGIPISILKSFAAPPPALVEDNESLQARVASTATSLLGLIGVDADPIQSREHILISNIFNNAWKSGRDLDLAGLIGEIQKPAMARVGVLDLESFFPAKERFALAMRLNNLLASPGFSMWLEGEALDVGAALHTHSGKPRVSIFSIAHLSDAERMFFVSLLLNQTLSWMRTQSGTTSLRAMLYMDEIFGYFPPVANPPSKQPLLTLLKQARAFGLGIVLATQNPVDLDYKGLANAGTWFVGRLQTERDKQRLLEGLEGAATQGGGAFDRARMTDVLSALSKRVFLMNNVHDTQPTVFESRWTLSYLRGPLTRAQIKMLTDARRGGSSAIAPAAPTQVAPVAATPPASKRAERTSEESSAHPTASARERASPATAAATTEPQANTAPVARESSSAPATPVENAAASSQRPLVPPEIPQYFAPLNARVLARNTRLLAENSRPSAGNAPPPSDARITYRPALFASAQVYFQDAKTGVASEASRAAILELGAPPRVVDWERAEPVEFDETKLETEPAASAQFLPLAPEANRAKSYDAWKKSLVDFIYRTQKLEILRSPSTKTLSHADESERDFRIRLQLAAREERDRAKAKLRDKYAPQRARLEDRVHRAELARQKEQEQATQSKVQTAISFGTTLLSALTGRKALSAGTIGRATTAARGVGRSMKDSADVARAGENVDSMKRELAELDAAFDAEVATLETKIDPLTEVLETIAIKPKKTNIDVRVLALCWLPSIETSDGRSVRAWG